MITWLFYTLKGTTKSLTSKIFHEVTVFLQLLLNSWPIYKISASSSVQVCIKILSVSEYLCIGSFALENDGKTKLGNKELVKIKLFIVIV